MKPNWSLSLSTYAVLALAGGLCLDRPGLAGGLDHVPGSRYTSGRGAAMGDAFLPLADDGPGGLFYNPAALAKVRFAHIEPMNFQFGANTDYTGNFDKNFYKVTSLSSNLPTLDEHKGLMPGVGGALLPNAYFRGFGFGVLYNTRFAASTDGKDVHYRSLYQLIPAVGGALRLASGVLRIGYSLQWVNQASGDITVPHDSSPLGYNQGLNMGSALSHNVGFALTLPYTDLPALNIVARNLGGAKFSKGSIFPLAQNVAGPPADEPMSLDASLSISPKLGSGVTANWVLEDRDITNTSKISPITRAALGLELSFRESFFIRGGYGSAYPSAGIGFKQKRGEFSVTWYSEELGDSYHAERETRLLFHYQIRAF